MRTFGSLRAASMLTVCSSISSASAAMRWALLWSSWISEARSEEHTSELQSRRDLVCRLLLEKKKGGVAEPEEVPSRHLTTLAQQVRGRDDRFIATRRLLDHLAALPAGRTAEIDVSLGNVATSLVVIPKVRKPNLPEWHY